ncbi:MAG: family 16 glycosylhydrolase [Bacteroidota bacterium]
MLKASLGLFILTPVLTMAQTVQDDFEGGGTINTWFGDDCGLNVNFGNPFKQGINTSATVLEYHDTGGQYANVRFDVASNYDLSANYTFSLKIYVPSSGLTGDQINQLSLKLQDKRLAEPWSTQSEIIKSISLDQWQEVSFDFKNDNYINLDNNSAPPTDRTDFNRVVIQVNGENNNDHVLAYLDDVSYDGTITIEEFDDPVYDSLVWADEFDGDGGINTSKWHHQTQLLNGVSWYNNEIQHYTNRIENSFVSDGTLKILAKKETFTDQGFTKQYTSARLNSKYVFTYGRVEIRAKMPFGVGTWPALWMLGKNINEDGGYWDNQGFGTTPWPQCGEIDIIEHWGDNQNYIASATHTPSSFGNTFNKGGRIIPTVSSDFHVYSLDWYEERLVFSVDDVIHYTYNPGNLNANTWPFDAEFYLLFNVAILPNIDVSFIESTLEVDYVRVYQESGQKNEEKEEEDEEDDNDDEGEETITSISNFENIKAPVYPNPVKDQLTIQLREPTHGSLGVKIYGFDGSLILDNNYKVIQNEVTISHLESLPQGLYFLFYSVDGKTLIRKFVRN